MSSHIRTRLWRTIAATSFVVGAAATAAAQDKTVTLMHVEQTPAYVDMWRKVADQYEAANPGIKIDLQFLENEAFKAKLPTLLQSDDAPDLFYSWTGGVLHAQDEAGAVRDITPEMQADGGAWADSYLPATMGAVTFGDRTLCVPLKISYISFFYNKPLFEKAGVNADDIKTWDDFLATVQKLKDAGITPISAGGGDKWPLHFYWSYLAVRLGGKDAFAAAKAGEGDGFTSEPFVKAFEMVKELGEMEPFQPGYLGTRWQDSLATFGDGRAAMILSFDNTAARQAAAAADGKGIAHDDLGVFQFPAVEGGAGEATDTFGGVNCWVVSRDASPEAIDFVKFFTSKEAEEQMAAIGMMIPAAKGAGAAITDPLVLKSSDDLSKSNFHQLFLDQDLGPSTGRVVNDVTVEVISGSMEPEEAAQMIQDEFELDL